MPDNVFLMRLLPKVQGNLLTFSGQCIRQADSSEQFKSRVLKEYFPLFGREKMIRELEVFHFQKKDCPLREFIKEVVGAAEFLQCRESEGEILNRILLNLHPDILAQAAFLPRPGSYRESRDMVGLIEDRMAVLAEHLAPDTGSSSSQKRQGVVYRKISRVGRLSMASRPAGMGLRVGVVGSRGMFRGIVRCYS